MNYLKLLWDTVWTITHIFNRQELSIMVKQITQSYQVTSVHAITQLDIFGITFQLIGFIFRRIMQNTSSSLELISSIPWQLFLLQKSLTSISMMTISPWWKMAERNLLVSSCLQTKKTDHSTVSCTMMRSWCFMLL